MEQLDWVKNEELVRNFLDAVNSGTLSKAAKMAAVVELLAPLGIDLPEPPASAGWSATDIGLSLGLSAQAVGRLATKHSIKDDKHGEYRLSKSRYSTKQVETFVYNEAGRAAIQRIAQQQTLQ